ncbi:MBL fold metallo-hydrolase [Oscillatoria sp. FACHB-1406]|uniref:MBL fold metallo-hydrolase n=1 Tax=Oscillatoria sp. FACHB-1406 TaxID=2692846 RepID=UPI001685D5BC|nr:MBL fold metallo-hydrolase [Oscillatoria sp. FACHB-1406]MBD2577306.1 MBL fold metallo-hydrolase [Oscillatoria sp. FACHB-1406]
MSPARSESVSDRDRLSCFPYGVGHSTEGVCLSIRLGPHRILLDCGLQDLSSLTRDRQPPADWVFCTNARRDRARGLLELHETYPQLPIYGSEVTAKLLPLNWLERPLDEIPRFCQGIPWRSLQELSKGLTIELFPAGNLPGSAAILLSYAAPERTYKVLYTGDFFLSNSRLVEGLSVESLRGSSPDILIIEGTYGTARHPRRRQQEKQLIEKIDRALAENRSVLLPVPPLGLGQEILMLLRSHHQFTGRDVDIWVDGEVAIACDFYLELLPQLPTSVQNFAKHQALFWDEQILPHLRRLSGNFEKIPRYPCIAIVDDTLDFRTERLPDSELWTILWPEPLSSERRDELEQQLLEWPNYQLDSYLLSEHSDGRNTTQLIHNIRPQHVIFVRGSALNLADLTSLEELQNRYQLHSPPAGTLVELPVGDTFIQPAPPTETNYEGELNELETSVNIILPNAIAIDPHWKNFAETGIVEARWQGEELVLRGLSQRELLGNSQQTRPQIDLDCCGTCLHQRSQRCYNPASPLYSFKVTPDGYCPAFEMNNE